MIKIVRAIQKYHRHSIRLSDYNYSSKGHYFITIYTWNRECLFGKIFEKEIHLNDFGKIAQNEWIRTQMVRSNIALDKFVIMPNHMHGIIMIVDDGRRGVLQYAPTNQFRSPSQTVGSVIRGFKSIVTKQINILRKTPSLPIWQRNYYEHVVRDDAELNRIRQYVIDNPLNWDSDKENPNYITKSG